MRWRPDPSDVPLSAAAPANGYCLAATLALAADYGDVWFINGQPLADEAQIADLRRRPRKGEPLAFGLAAPFIARETEKEAQGYYGHLAELAAKDAQIRAAQKANIDDKVVMLKTTAKSPRLGTDGGKAAGLVGSYDQVAERIHAFHRAGIERFMLQFQPLLPELRAKSSRVSARPPPSRPRAGPSLPVERTLRPRIPLSQADQALTTVPATRVDTGATTRD